MKVYCPCGNRCKGFSGSPRKCEQIGTSGTMPQEFVGDEGFLDIVLRNMAPALAGMAGTELTYHVYQCPACKCKVLIQSVKNGKNTDMSEVGKISRCRG